MSPALNYGQLEQASTWEAASCLVRCKSCVSYKGKEYVFDTFVINETTQGSHLDQAPAIGRSLVKGRGIQDRLQLAFPDSLRRAVCGSGACQVPELSGNLGHQKPRLPPVAGGGQVNPLPLGHWASRSHLHHLSGGAGEQWPPGMLLRELALWAQKFCLKQKWPVQRRKNTPCVKKKWVFATYSAWVEGKQGSNSQIELC